MACGADTTQPEADLPPSQTTDEFIPLSELGTTRYLGFAGGLYPDGNALPTAHAQLGAERARQIRPLDQSGQPDANGKYVLLSIGMSNTTQEFCSADSGLPCEPWTFMGQAATDPAVNHQSLVIVNGARGGQAAEAWTSPDSLNYDRIRDTRLRPLGLSEAQVQIVWLKVADRAPTTSLPDPNADAYVLERRMGDIVRASKVRYPNLQQVFLSSRTYGGYATGPLNPEPYAYESGFAVKWLIEAQIEQAASGVVDPIAGTLSLTTAPWVAWGPYLWAAGTAARSDGLVWERGDFQNDGTHPSRAGEQKVGTLLLNFFRTSPQTRCWFLSGQLCS